MWLRKILNLKPAKWPVGRSIRIAIGIGTPLTIGLLSNHILFFLWFTLGVMMQSTGEGTGSYRSLVRMTLISAPIGALGYFAADLWNVSGPLAITVLTLAAFFAGIINSYGAAYSKGTLQALLGASLAFGLGPELHGVITSWQMVLLYLCGTTFYLFLLGLEALIDKRRPQRQLLSDYLVALAAFTQTHANYLQDPSARSSKENARSTVIDKYALLYDVLIDTRTANTVRSKENQNNAAILHAGDSIFSHVLAQSDIPTLQSLATWLQQLANAVLHKKPLPIVPEILQANERLQLRTQNLTQSIASLDSIAQRASREFHLALKGKISWRRWLDHLIVGPEVIKSASILALCMGIAFSMKYVVHGNHWYWVPLTVSLVMKPELGSVFVRAVLRLVGTAFGVIIGSVILMVLPKSLFMVFIIAAIAACMPWAMQRSYALLSLFITPMVLLLIDIVTPGTININYAGQRLMDTAIGGTIVLIFGYFIWPRSHEKQLATSYKAAMTTLAEYFNLVCTANPATQESRRLIYSQLSNLRAQLQKQLSEPPPGDREAAKWFPIIASAERLTDCITIYAENRTADHPLPDEAQAKQITQKMLTITDSETQINSTHKDPFLDEVLDELNTIFRLIHTTQSTPLASQMVEST